MRSDRERQRRRSRLLTIALTLVWIVALPATADHHMAGEPGKGAPAAGSAEAGAQPAHDLSLAKRKEIFRALAAAQVRADRDAAKQAKGDPESLGESELALRLRREYQAKVIGEHGITKRRAEEITEEGYAKEWSTVGGGGDPGGREETELD